MFYGSEDHYEKVKAKRKELGLDTRGQRQKDIENSPYLHKYLVDKTTGKRYLVERDYKEYSCWGFGWYQAMVLNCNGSHRVIWYKNINNDDNIVKEAVIKTRKNFNLY